jgi:serine/threonine protein kinase
VPCGHPDDTPEERSELCSDSSSFIINDKPIQCTPTRHQQTAPIRNDTASVPLRRSELGKGAFAVTLRMAAPGGLLCAVKRFQRRDMARARLSEEAVRKEAELLGKLQHPLVIRYLGLVRTPKHLLLVMELAAGGSLEYQVRLQNYMQL